MCFDELNLMLSLNVLARQPTGYGISDLRKLKFIRFIFDLYISSLSNKIA